MYRIWINSDGQEYGVKRLSDGVAIPPDPRNADWQEYQLWLAAGNEPDPAE